jgi:glycosyltransferase involved in cell wall biosynthesis
MPVYNCEGTIALAIKSVQKQTLDSWELIVIDDGSSDKTLELIRGIRDPRIRLFADGQNRHLPARLNQAVAAARGKYFARMDGDDISFPVRFEKQTRFLVDHPETDLLGGQHIVFRGNGELVGTLRTVLDHESICGTWWSGFNLSHPTWIGPIGWFRQNPYNEQAARSQDRELLLATHRFSRFAAVPDYVYGHRVEEVSLSKTFPARLSYLKAGWRNRTVHHEYLMALAVATAEIGKIGVDAIAVWTGLNYRLLRHRARPASPEARRIWEEAWAEITAD